MFVFHYSALLAKCIPKTYVFKYQSISGGGGKKSHPTQPANRVTVRSIMNSHLQVMVKHFRSAYLNIFEALTPGEAHGNLDIFDSLVPARHLDASRK